MSSCLIAFWHVFASGWCWHRVFRLLWASNLLARLLYWCCSSSTVAAMALSFWAVTLALSSSRLSQSGTNLSAVARTCLASLGSTLHLRMAKSNAPKRVMGGDLCFF